MSTNFAKTLVWKQDYDVILLRHKQRTPNTNDYPLPLHETPPWNVSVYATVHDGVLKLNSSKFTFTSADLNIFVIFNAKSVVLNRRQGHNEGGKGTQSPRRRITAGGAEKSQKCHKHFLQYSAFPSERPQVEHGGAKFASCPGRHLTSLRPWLGGAPPQGGGINRFRGGTYLLSRAALIVHYRWRVAKSIDFILKVYLYLPMTKNDFSWLSKYLFVVDLRFDTMLYSNLCNENSVAGYIKCLRGPQVPHPCLMRCATWTLWSIY